MCVCTCAPVRVHVHALACVHSHTWRCVWCACLLFCGYPWRRRLLWRRPPYSSSQEPSPESQLLHSLTAPSQRPHSSRAPAACCPSLPVDPVTAPLPNDSARPVTAPACQAWTASVGPSATHRYVGPSATHRYAGPRATHRYVGPAGIPMHPQPAAPPLPSPDRHGPSPAPPTALKSSQAGVNKSRRRPRGPHTASAPE